MSDNDKLAELTPEEAKKQKKMLTKEAKLANDIEAQLLKMDGPNFDFHLFLLLFTIFKEGQADIRIKHYINQMGTDDFDRFAKTILTFNEFLNLFIKLGVDRPPYVDPFDMPMLELGKLAGMIDEYNRAQGEAIFRLPDLEEAKPSLFSKLKEKLSIGGRKQK